MLSLGPTQNSSQGQFSLSSQSSQSYQLTQLSSLENTAAITGVFYKVLDYLSWFEVPAKTSNHQKISMLMSYFSNLACTSKEMYNLMNHEEVKSLYLQELLIRFPKIPDYLAERLNAEEVKKWFWVYIKLNKYDKVYQTIQNIYKVVLNILREAKEVGLDYHIDHNYGIGRDSILRNPKKQLKSGFLLCDNSKQRELETPLGTVDLFRIDTWSKYATVSISEALIQKLDGILEKVAYTSTYSYRENSGFHQRHDFNNIQEVEASHKELEGFREINKEYIRPLSREVLETRKGSKNIILSIKLHGAYRIQRVGNTVLPELQEFDSEEEKLSENVICKIWATLEEGKKKLQTIKDLEDWSFSAITEEKKSLD